MSALEAPARPTLGRRAESRAAEVLEALQHFARNGVVAQLPSTIAQWSGVSTDTVSRGIKDLIELGHIEDTQIRSGKARVYRLLDVESPQASSVSPHLAAVVGATAAGGTPTGSPAASLSAADCGCVDGWLVGTHRWLDADLDTAEPCPVCQPRTSLAARVAWGARGQGRTVCTHRGCSGRQTCQYEDARSRGAADPETLETLRALIARFSSPGSES